MGRTSLNQAITEYVKKHKLGSVVHGDFLRELDNVLAAEGRPADLAERLKTWIEESGYPVVTLARDVGAANPHQITYNQTRFCMVPSNCSEIVWHVPLTLTHGAAVTAPVTQETTQHGCWLDKSNGERHQILGLVVSVEIQSRWINVICTVAISRPRTANCGILFWCTLQLKGCFLNTILTKYQSMLENQVYF